MGVGYAMTISLTGLDRIRVCFRHLEHPLAYTVRDTPVGFPSLEEDQLEFKIALSQ